MDQITELTPAQERLLDKVSAEYIANITKPEPFDMGVTKKWLAIVYSYFDLPLPARIEVCDSPYAALRLSAELTGEKRTATDWCGIGDGGWVAFYDYFTQIGVLNKGAEETKHLLALAAFRRQAWDVVLLDECAIVVPRPIRLTLDDEGNLHSFDGPCLEWADGEKDYAHHGFWVSERAAMKPRSYSAKEYGAITNTEERRAIAERAGWDHIATMLGAHEVDKWSDPETNLTYQLMRCADGTALLKKKSPALKNKTQPSYIEPVHESLRTARAARKWQATTLTPEQCEADPALTYGAEA